MFLIPNILRSSSVFHNYIQYRNFFSKPTSYPPFEIPTSTSHRPPPWKHLPRCFYTRGAIKSALKNSSPATQHHAYTIITPRVVYTRTVGFRWLVKKLDYTRRRAKLTRRELNLDRIISFNALSRGYSVLRARVASLGIDGDKEGERESFRILAVDRLLEARARARDEAVR